MRYVAAGLDDVYEADDGRRVVLLGQEVLVISPLAAALLDGATGDGAEIPDLVRTLVEAFGEPPSGSDAVVIVEANLSDLVARGLVTVVPGS